MWEGKGENHSRITYLGYPRLSNKELFKGESSQVPYLVVYLVLCLTAGSLLSKMDVFEMDVLAIKSLMSGSYTAHGVAKIRGNELWNRL